MSTLSAAHIDTASNLLELTTAFDVSNDLGEPQGLVSRLQAVSDIDANAFLNVASARIAMRSALESGDYELACHAYNVIDCVLRDETRSAIQHLLIDNMHLSDEATVWVTQGSQISVTKAEVVQIADAINSARIGAYGRPEELCEESLAAVHAHFNPLNS